MKGRHLGALEVIREPFPVSRAALRLKARARMDSGGMPWLRTRCATLPVITAVFPVPAPASTSVTSSSVAMFRACSSVRPSLEHVPGRFVEPAGVAYSQEGLVQTAPGCLLGPRVPLSLPATEETFGCQHRASVLSFCPPC